MNGPTFEELPSQQLGNSNIINAVSALRNRKASQASKQTPLEVGNYQTNSLASTIKNIESELAQEEYDRKTALQEAKDMKTLGNLQAILNGSNKNMIQNNNFNLGNTKDFTYENYLNKLLNVESRGNYNATNKSGATGGYQFFESTAAPYLKKYNKTWDDFKRNSKLQDQIAMDHTLYNANALQKAGLPVNNLTLWTLHNQGTSGGIDLLREGKINVKNLSSNLPKGTEPTAANFVSFYSPKFI